MASGSYRRRLQQELVSIALVRLLHGDLLLTLDQHDILPQLQIHLPNQSFGYLRQEIWKRGVAVKELGGRGET